MWNPFAKKDPESVAKRFANKAFEAREDRETLAAICTDAMSSLRHVRSVVREDLQLQLYVDGGPEHFIANLDNHIVSLVRAESVDDSREALLALLGTTDEVRALHEEDDAGLSADRVVPLIRSVEFAEQAIPGDGSLPATIELADGLCLMFAEDRPTSFRYLRIQDLEELSDTPADAVELAVRNLIERIEDIEIIEGEHGLRFVACGGNYEASLLLLDGFWRDMEADYTGPAIACVPARDLLAFTDSGDAEAVKALRLWTDGIAAAPDITRRVSNELYVRVDGGWSVVEPDEPRN